MKTLAAAALAFLAAIPSRAQQAAESPAAQWITDQRLELKRDKLPLVQALPARLETEEPVPGCSEGYDSYRQKLDDFDALVTHSMHHHADPSTARSLFEAAYPCAAKLARKADPAAFESRSKRLTPVERRRMAAELSRTQLSQDQAKSTFDQADRMAAALQSRSDGEAGVDERGSAVSSGGAAGPSDAGPMHRKDFEPQYHDLDLDQAQRPPEPAAALPQTISGSIASDLKTLSGRLSPIIVAATCMVESNCRQTVNGRTVQSTYVNGRTGEIGHAYGVMQIIPDTARNLAAQLHVSEYQILHDASTNIRAGTAYLESKFEAFHADIGSLDADLAEFTARVKRSFSDQQLAAAERGLSGGRCARSAAMPIVEQVVQTAFASGLGPVVMGWAAYNGQVHPDQVAYSRYNRESHDYVFRALMSAKGMVRAPDGLQEASLRQPQYRNLDAHGGGF